MNKMLLTAGTDYTVKYVRWCMVCHDRFDDDAEHDHPLIRTAAIAYKN